MSHNTLENYYKTIWALNFHHKYSITEIEGMYPYERDIYLDLISSYVEEQNSKQGGDQPGGLYDMDGSYVGPAG